MKYKRRLGGEDTLETVIDLAETAARVGEDEKYSMSLEFALTELVREEMRKIAQEQYRQMTSVELLKDSTRRVLTRVDESLQSSHVDLDFVKYEKQVRRKLKFPAKEMQKLGMALAESREKQRLGAKDERALSRGRAFVVHELGLRDAIQGILVEPTEQIQELDVDALRERGAWSVEGEWFPYEVRAMDFIFVVDDDGSIFVSTEALPVELREQVVQLANEIAIVLFG